MPKEFYQCTNLKTYFNSNHKLLTSKGIPPFYKKIHDLYMKHFKKEPTNLAEILDQSLWLNEKTKSNKKYLYLKLWEKKYILTVRNLFNEFGILLTDKELQDKYQINTTFLQTLQVHENIPSNWIKLINNTNHTLPPCNTEIKIKINNNLKSLSLTSSKDSYWHLINSATHIPSCIINK
jgi:hypothetical protein